MSLKSIKSWPMIPTQGLYLTFWVSYHVRAGSFPRDNAMLDQLQMHLSKEVFHSLEVK